VTHLILEYQRLLVQLRKHEGVVLKPYRCSVGKLTIGVGRNLDDNGISLREAEMMLTVDVQAVLDDLGTKVPVFFILSEVRKHVLVDMCFNLGITRLLRFRRFLKALTDQDWDTAGVEMEDSRWFKQVGVRAKTLQKMMLTDKFPT